MKEPSVELILARRPRAGGGLALHKGRVERRDAVFQDRLVKAMRPRKISSIDPANLPLEKMFLDDLNNRYAVKAKKLQNLHRAVDASMALDEVGCVREERVAGRDWHVRWKNRRLRIEKRHAALCWAGERVRVRQKRDGVLIVEHKHERLAFTELSQRLAPRRANKPIINNRRWKPGPSHPWSKPARATPPARRADPRGSLAQA